MGNWIPRREAESEVLSVSLGLVVIDEIRFASRPPITDVPGGSATYATLGHRLLAERERAGEVGCIVRAGSDFPKAIRDQLEGWKLNLRIIVCADRLSTRGLLEYEDDTFGPKKFHYTTPPLKPSPAHLSGSPLLRSKAFHVLATPQEIWEHIPELLRLRAQVGIHERPYIVWEPFPAACVMKNRESFFEACHLVDVFSPNHHQMTALFEESPQDGFRPEVLQRYARKFASRVGQGMSEQGCVIIRAGEHGSLTVVGSNRSRWLPAFYSGTSDKVVDPTGAGNTYLGGFMMGWHCTHDVEEASVWGSVAASFALEQIGLPSHCMVADQEHWNGANVFERLKEYKTRIENPVKILISE